MFLEFRSRPVLVCVHPQTCVNVSKKFWRVSSLEIGPAHLWDWKLGYITSLMDHHNAVASVLPQIIRWQVIYRKFKFGNLPLQKKNNNNNKIKLIIYFPQNIYIYIYNLWHQIMHLIDIWQFQNLIAIKTEEAHCSKKILIQLSLIRLTNTNYKHPLWQVGFIYTWF